MWFMTVGKKKDLRKSTIAIQKQIGDNQVFFQRFLRWLTTVFLRLSSARYDSLPHVSICRACKNDASNLKK